MGLEYNPAASVLEVCGSQLVWLWYGIGCMEVCDGELVCFKSSLGAQKAPETSSALAEVGLYSEISLQCILAEWDAPVCYSDTLLYSEITLQSRESSRC